MSQMRPKLSLILPLLLTALTLLSGCVSNSDSAGSPELKAIDLSAGALEPAFDAKTTSYIVRVDEAIDKIQIAPFQTHYLASTEINGTRVANGQYSPPISLAPGENLVELRVTAQDGVIEKSYFLNIIRGPYEPTTPSGGTPDNNDGQDNGDNGAPISGNLPAPSGGDYAPGSDFLYQAYYLKATNPSRDAKFGSKVAAYGNTIVVGAPREDGAKGAAYVFVESGDSISAPLRLQPADLNNDDHFGNGIAIEGTTLVISATHKDSGAYNAGAVYTYQYQNGGWKLVDTLTPSQPGHDHRFGAVLRLSGNTLAVATLRNSADNGGGVYVYTRNGNGWQEQAYIHPDRFGSHDIYSRNIDLKGDVLVIGSFSPDDQCRGGTGDPGSVTTYTRTGNYWQHQSTLYAPSPDAADRFGYSVSLDGNRLAVGAMCDDGESNANTQQGAAYIFTHQGTRWIPQQTIRASGGTAHSLFGDEVILRGNTLVASASYESSTGLNAAGAIYVFREQGGHWVEKNTLRANNLGENDRFGQALDVSGGKIIVGAPEEDSGSTSNENDNSSSHAGAVYVFK